MPSKPAPVTTIMEVIKEGPTRARLSENGLNPASPPVIDGMYIYKYVAARFGPRIKVTIESADSE